MNRVEVFLSDDLSPSSVYINFFVAGLSNPGKLHSFRIQLNTTSYPYFSVSEIYAISCVSAIPVLATRHDVSDTLIVTTEGSLAIITSSGRRLTLNIPKQLSDGRDEVAYKLASSLNMTVDDDDLMDGRRPDQKVVNLLDPVGSRCTVIFEDGKQIRISADLRIHHELLRRCFEALSNVLSEEGFFILKRELLAQMNSLSAVQRRSDAAIWAVFSKVLQQMLGFSVSDVQQSAFGTLLSRATEASDPITRRLAGVVRDRHSPHDNDSLTGETTLIFGEMLPLFDAAPVILVLHLVAQDCRLSSTRRADLLRMAPLVIDIAARIGKVEWQDYWMRLMPTTTLLSAHGESSQEYARSSLKRVKRPSTHPSSIVSQRLPTS